MPNTKSVDELLEEIYANVKAQFTQPSLIIFRLRI